MGDNPSFLFAVIFVFFESRIFVTSVATPLYLYFIGSEERRVGKEC